MLDFIKIFIIVLVIFIMTQGYANANSVNRIDIKPNMIHIDFYGKINTKKISDNEINIFLKDTIPSKDLKISYNNTGLNNIVVKQDKNNTKIIIKTPDAKNIKVVGTNTSKANNFNYCWLLGLLLLLKRKPKKQETKSVQYRHNVDYILKNKAKKQKEKIKIAA